MSKSVVIALICFVVVAILGVSVYSYTNSLRSEGIVMETQLTAQYLSNQNNLSSYISGFYEQLGIVKYKSSQLDKILQDYAQGRNFNASGQGSFVNAVVEAVPDLAGLNIADRMMDYVQAGRQDYKTIQDKLLDMLRSYDRWRADGFIQSIIIAKVLGIPSQRLEARVSQASFLGEAARDMMYTIVLAPQAAEAYTSGQLAPLTAE